MPGFAGRDEVRQLLEQGAQVIESLGFREVYDYVNGEADRLAFGLPREGRARLIVDALDRRRARPMRPSRTRGRRSRVMACAWW